MIKKNKAKVIISSIVILLPMLFGIIFWKELPDIMATHFGISGKADGFSGKAFTVFGMPLMMLALHILSLVITSLDKRQNTQSAKALSMMFWIIPMISLITNGLIYSIAFERELNNEMLLPAIIGVMFTVMGNYLPKIKQNSTLGIKLWWTILNEENWNKTHRFGGKVWVISGFITLLSMFFPIEISVAILVCVTVVAAVLPTVYSYVIYRQHKKVGIIYNYYPKSKSDKIIRIIGISILCIVLVGTVILMFTGNVEVKVNENSFEIDATYWTDIEVGYSEIESIEYRKSLDVGIRTNGFASARLQLGNFKNDEFGTYTLYAYSNAKEYIVLTSGEENLVIGMKDAKETAKIYDEICQRIGEK